MNQLKKMVVSVLTVVSVGVLCAGEFTWTGAAGDNDWSNGANWGGTAPGDSDTAIFPIAATVTPPATFIGLIRVNGSECLTVDITTDTRFSLALGTADFTDTGASFRKIGQGKLTLQANSGINPGTVTIAEGSVAFAGNGDVAAGAFDRVVIESGVTATVVESPIASRHGYAYRIGKAAAGTDANDFYKNGDVPNLVSRYTDWLYVNSDLAKYAGTHTVAEDVAAFDQSAAPMSVYANYDNQPGVVVYYRGLFLSDIADTSTWMLTMTKGNTSAIRMGFNSKVVCSAWPSGDKPTSSFSASVRRGWNALTFADYADLRYWGTWSRGMAFNLVCSSPEEGDDGVLSGGKLWSGVCFTSLQVASGASLSLADGMALAIANARGLKVSGSLGGASANTYLLLASDWSETEGDAKLSAAAIKDFPGKVELGRKAKLVGDDTASTASYRIVGRGELTVVDAITHCIDEEFAGPLCVKTGADYSLPLSYLKPVLTEKSALQPVSADTWQLDNNAAFINDGTAIQVLDKNNVNYRASVIGKNGIPVYCPFKMSCDMYLSKSSTQYASAWAVMDIGLFVQSQGSSVTYLSDMWSSRPGYMLPYSYPAFGFCGNAYSRCTTWVLKALNLVTWSPNNYTAEYFGESTEGDSWKWNAGGPIHFELTYDGFGSFVSFAQTTVGDGVVQSKHSYPQLSNSKYSGTTFYPSILTFCQDSSLANLGTIAVSNLSVKVLSSPSPFSRDLTVAENATLSVKASQVDAADGTPAVDFTNLSLLSGSTLSIAPHFSGLTTGAKVSGVKVAGPATIAAADGVTTVIGDVNLVNGVSCLSVLGGNVSVSEPLTLTVSRSALKQVPGAATVLDLSALAEIPSVDISKVTVVNSDDGTDMTAANKVAVSYANGKLTLDVHRGLIIVVE